MGDSNTGQELPSEGLPSPPPPQRIQSEPIAINVNASASASTNLSTTASTSTSKSQSNLSLPSNTYNSNVSECDTVSITSLEISEDHFRIEDDVGDEVIFTSRSQLETAIAKYMKLLRIQGEDQAMKRKLVEKICELRIKLNQMLEVNEQLYVNGHRLVKLNNGNISSSSAIICDVCLMKKPKMSINLLSKGKSMKGAEMLECHHCGLRVHSKEDCKDRLTRVCPRVTFEESFRPDIDQSQASYSATTVTHDNSPSYTSLSPAMSSMSSHAVILKVCPEVGLSSQQFKCADCNAMIVYDTSRICDYDGKYYCFRCHWGDDVSPIPARIIRNWDFTNK